LAEGAGGAASPGGAEGAGGAASPGDAGGGGGGASPEGAGGGGGGTGWAEDVAVTVETLTTVASVRLRAARRIPTFARPFIRSSVYEGPRLDSSFPRSLLGAAESAIAVDGIHQGQEAEEDDDGARFGALRADERQSDDR